MYMNNKQHNTKTLLVNFTPLHITHTPLLIYKGIVTSEEFDKLYIQCDTLNNCLRKQMKKSYLYEMPYHLKNCHLFF